MAAQDEREPGVVVMCSVLDPMVQDPPVQDIPIPEQDESLPQTNPEPEMGAAAAEAAVSDTSPPLPHQNPPTLAETAQPVMVDMAQICAMLAVMSANMNETREEIKNNTNNMEAHTNGGDDHTSDERGDAANGKQNGWKCAKLEGRNKRNEGRNEGNAG